MRGKKRYSQMTTILEADVFSDIESTLAQGTTFISF